MTFKAKPAKPAKPSKRPKPSTNKFPTEPTATRGRRYRENRRTLLDSATRCHWCKAEISDALEVGHPRKATADHLVPVSKGGTDALENLVASCWKCNSARGNRDPELSSFHVEGADDW